MKTRCVFARKPYACAFVLASALTLNACSGGACRSIALRHADEYKAKGFQTRIITYENSLASRAFDLFLFPTHAQAQVMIGNSWKYIGTFDGLPGDEPTFRNVGRLSVVWTPESYKKSIEAGRYVEE